MPGRTCSVRLRTLRVVTAGLPFPSGDADGAAGTLASAPIRSLNPAVPERLADLDRTVAEAADRADRPSSARAVELELRQASTPARRHSHGAGTGRCHCCSPPRRAPQRRRLLVMVAALMVATTIDRNHRTHQPSQP